MLETLVGLLLTVQAVAEVRIQTGLTPEVAQEVLVTVVPEETLTALPVVAVLELPVQAVHLLEEILAVVVVVPAVLAAAVVVAVEEVLLTITMVVPVAVEQSLSTTKLCGTVVLWTTKHSHYIGHRDYLLI
jgi:hypothetical protein